MFKLGESPSAAADPVEHADYLEIECLRQSDQNISSGDLIARLSRMDDDLPEDRSKVDLRMDNIGHDAFGELAERTQHSGNGHYRYPFTVSPDGTLLNFEPAWKRGDLYLFLLMATRMNMRNDKVQDGIDGTLLFEEVCCEVAKNYWGDRTDGMVFGTARRQGNNPVGSFENAVGSLCTRLGEGVAFLNHSGTPITAQDGNLDVVVWKTFSDRRNGQLIGFGQCKTGTTWVKGSDVHEMQPDAFIKKWVRTAPTVKPVRLFFVTVRLQTSRWFNSCVDAGIIFDRCRIIDFAPKMPTLRPLWQRWTRAALLSQGMKIP